MIPKDKDTPILIIGAGVFGLSTAFHLLRRGYTNVTVADRAESLPAVDAAGSDLNKSRSIFLYYKLERKEIDG